MALKFALTVAVGLTAASAAISSASAADLVIATTGGLMRNTMQQYMYQPFTKQTSINVIPFDIEVPPQWARAEGMERSGNVQFDIVTATGPDLVGKTNLLEPIPCSTLTNVQKYGLPDSCEPYGVARTTGGMVLAYSHAAFPHKAPQSWADFWDVKDFPGARGLPATGDSDWWVPAAALLADGVTPQKLFPLDLDRAYRKLDQLKNNVSVWWTTGNQVQQIMRDNEVVMTMSYSGRALATIKDGADWSMSWNGALRDTGYFAILKGAPDKDAALKFINFFYGNLSGQAGFMQTVGYATSSQAGLSQLPPDQQKLYATYPANYATLIKPDFKWIGDNRAMLEDRWNSWITK